MLSWSLIATLMLVLLHPMASFPFSIWLKFCLGKTSKAFVGVGVLTPPWFSATREILHHQEDYLGQNRQVRLKKRKGCGTRPLRSEPAVLISVSRPFSQEVNGGIRASHPVLLHTLPVVRLVYDNVFVYVCVYFYVSSYVYSDLPQLKVAEKAVALKHYYAFFQLKGCF